MTIALDEWIPPPSNAMELWKAARGQVPSNWWTMTNEERQRIIDDGEWISVVGVRTCIMTGKHAPVCLVCGKRDIHAHMDMV